MCNIYVLYGIYMHYLCTIYVIYMHYMYYLPQPSILLSYSGPLPFTICTIYVQYSPAFNPILPLWPLTIHYMCYTCTIYPSLQSYSATLAPYYSLYVLYMYYIPQPSILFCHSGPLLFTICTFYVLFTPLWPLTIH